MKQGTGPKVDPDKVRAWQQRSRERAARNAAEKPRAPLARSALAAQVAPSGARQQQARPVRFRARRRARDFRCFRATCPRHAAHWHHWLPQELIKVFVDTLRIRDDDEERAALRELLRDERNLSPVCAGCHFTHEHPGVDTQRFGADDVPPTAHEFAAELGPEWAERLRRMYPAAGSSGVRPDGGADGTADEG